MTLASPLIFVPKKITQDVDFAPQLRSVIQKAYSESPDNYNDELAALNRTRQDALRGSAGSDTTARDLLCKYFGQLELLELRFPDLRVPFPWSDAFTHVKISQQSLAYEKASVIFNIGATLSSLAASSPRSAPEGLKRAFHSFRCAAGMFVYINENFLHAPSTDLSKEVVKLLVGLMGAQAVEVFIETMGPATGKSSGLRSKMCMQASIGYAALVEDAKEWVTKGVFLREWSLLIQAKSKYFASLANYHRSVADTAAGKYGEALARLNVSEALAKEANRFAQSFVASFSTTSTTTSLAADAPVAFADLAKTHLSLVSETRTKAQKDNDIVYNEVVPSEASLAPIEKGKSIADPIPIHDVYAAPDVQKLVGPDLFAKLVPLSVHESASLYSEEKAKLVRAEVERVELADEELASALEYMGLPASLARFQSGAAAQASLADPGPQVRGWADEIQHGEMDGRVDDLFRRLYSLKDRAASQLEQIASDLDGESRECEAMRAKYAHLWEQPPAAGLTRSFRQDLKAHRDSLEQAANSDAQAQGLLEGIKREVGILADTSGAPLERMFVEGVAAAQGGNEVSLLDDSDEGDEEETKRRVETVNEALARLNKIKKERGEVMRDLKEKVQADDISHILILNRKGPANVEPALFATELEKFRPHQQRLTLTLQAQQSCLSDVNVGFKALNEGSKARDLQNRFAAAERKKRELIARMGQAAQAYGDVKAALTKGTQFYQDLGDLIDGLKEQVSGYLTQRNGERERMASEADIKLRLEASGPASPTTLDRAMGSLNLGSAPSPPAVPLAPPTWSSSHSSYGAPTPLPAQPAASPYGNFPSTGVFGLSSPTSASPAPAAQPRPPQPPASYPSAPPVPPAPSSYQSSYQSAYASPTSATSPYGQPSRQTSLPPPPQPVSQSSYSSPTSALPPPPAPVSYSSSSSYGARSPAPPANPYGSYPSPTANAPPPVPQPPSQPQYSYGQPQQPQPPQQQYGQYGYSYRAPPPPARPY
ncbi:hypothetical protein JCM11641_006988 [Rhodosporidiobolus odoratus]